VTSLLLFIQNEENWLKEKGKKKMK
jgi:hypothetical protein